MCSDTRLQEINFINESILLTGNNIKSKRQEILQDFQKVFERYELLFETLVSDENFYITADPLRHPLIFYYAHTATFYINKFIGAQIISARIDPHLESITAVGVDEMSWDDLTKQQNEWPTVEYVRQYRKKVKDVVERLIDSIPLTLPIKWEDPMWIMLMGIEHEKIHLETSSVLIRQLPLACIKPHKAWPVCSITLDAPDNRLIPVLGQTVLLNKVKEKSSHYGWDNEYGYYKEDIAPFLASRYLVSNKEFLGFIEAEGYQDEKWWTQEGWQWRLYKKAQHPLFWRKQADGSWNLRLMLEEVAMPWDWPVEVNYLEAKAFCHWKGHQLEKSIRLPTEVEWHALYQQAQQHSAMKKSTDYNLQLKHYASSCPVTQFQTGAFYDVAGNVWQWTETEIFPFQGFQAHASYDDFSTPTFDNRHNIIKGGCWISTGNLALHDSRYAFRRHFYQHAGFRYVESSNPIINETVLHYESDKDISSYLEFHYGQTYFGVPNYPRACVEHVMQQLKEKLHFDSALEVGCAVGRAAFELASYFNRVEAIDYSVRFIQHAVILQKQDILPYSIPVEGDLSEFKEANLSFLGLSETKQRVHFKQADACNLVLPPNHYDLVLACNLIDRLYNPTLFLEHIHEIIKKGGFLVLSSPYTWLEEYTPKSSWVGGFKKDGENQWTIDGLRQMLSPHFNQYGSCSDLPFILRETNRKYQHTVAEISIWRKK